ncbi:MAG: PD40 domain-containing protein [Blastocatellia bacterium]|nr:PD40 domain-containing protein [Blastocatellia bacterium]
MIDLARGLSSRLTFDSGEDRYPAWSSDGSRIAWTATRGGAWQIYQKLSSGVGAEEVLLKSDVNLGSGSWSADGRFLLYTRDEPKTNTDIWVLPMAADRQPTVFLQTPFIERDGSFSPDGRWIAYASNDQGRPEVYVQTFPVSGGKWQISTNGGLRSLWRSDGKELYYVSADGKLMAVEVKPGGSFEATAPRALFDLAPVRAGGGYTVTAEGDRFLVTNWTAEAKK